MHSVLTYVIQRHNILIKHHPQATCSALHHKKSSKHKSASTMTLNSSQVRVQVNQPINSSTSATLAFYALCATQFTQYAINPKYILSLEVTKLILKLGHHAGGLHAATMGVQNLYTTITLHYLSSLHTTN